MRCAHKLLLASAACAALGGLCASSARADAFTYETIYLTDQLAPGTGSLFFRGFDAPVINNAGQIAFHGLYGTVGQTTNLTAGLWSNSPGSFQLAVRTGVDAPGTTITLVGFVGTSRVGIGGGGNIVFGGGLDQDEAGANDRGIWDGTPGAMSLQVREGNNVPGVNNSNPPFDGTTTPVFNNNLGLVSIGSGGHAAFTSAVSGDFPSNSINERSMFISTGPTTVTPVYIAGTQVPGETAGVLYAGDLSAFPGPNVNNAGKLAFLGGLKGGETGAAIFFGTAGDARVVTGVGRPAPGFAGNNIDSVNRPDVNDSDELVFVAGISSFGNSPPEDGDAIYFGTQSGGISPAARFGDAVATAPGLTYEEFLTVLGPITNDLGQIAFFASVAGAGVTTSNDTLVMAGQAGDPNDLLVIGREGDELPADLSFIAGPLISDDGFVAFALNAGGEDSLWVSDLSNNLTQVVSTADDGSIVGLSSTLEITALKLGTTVDGYRFLSDEGILTFGLTFDDGSEGIFKVSQIPEPAAGALLGLAALGLLVRRRRV